VDCISTDECSTGADCELVLHERIGERLFLFNGDVAILCRIKDFTALLAFNEFYVVLTGDDFDDGMFADGSHWVGSVIGMDFARLRWPCQPPFRVFLHGEVVVRLW